MTEHDKELGNVMLRAGYMRGLALRSVGDEERMWLLRASRSLQAYADELQEKTRTK